ERLEQGDVEVLGEAVCFVACRGLDDEIEAGRGMNDRVAGTDCGKLLLAERPQSVAVASQYGARAFQDRVHVEEIDRQFQKPCEINAAFQSVFLFAWVHNGLLQQKFTTTQCRKRRKRAFR